MILAALAACSAPSPPVVPEVHRLSGEAFGTTWAVAWRGEPSPDVAAVAIADVVQVVDQRMSTWRDDSELQDVRRGPGPVAVSEETFAVVDAALDLAQATGGAFDPTVEPLMALWGFRGERREQPPTEAEVEEIRDRIGWHRVVLSRPPEGPHIDAGGTALDLSAIAKGHAVDRVSQALSGLGAADHLVEIGGEVRAHGTGPSGAWRLGVDQPEEGRAPGSSLAAVVQLNNAALATSGNYRNAYEAGGVRLVHTMDPRTGRPYASPVASATVVGPDCRTADGWATALMVLDPEAGLAAIDARPGLEALLLIAGPDGFTEQRSAGMSLHLVDPRR